MSRVVLIEITRLRAHELVERDRVEKLKEDLRKSGMLVRPILVDERNLIIIDGHHRVQALRELGCKLVPALLIDYESSDICVVPWRDCDRVTKEEVVKAGLTGRLLPPKTSKHVVFCEGCERHVEFLEGEHPIPLEVLRGDSNTERGRPVIDIDLS